MEHSPSLTYSSLATMGHLSSHRRAQKPVQKKRRKVIDVETARKIQNKLRGALITQAPAKFFAKCSDASIADVSMCALLLTQQARF